MNTLFAFLASQNGRITRAAAGVILIVAGLLLIGGTAGMIVAVIGVVPLVAGLVDVCVFAPLFSLPFVGSALRSTLSGK